MSRDALAERRNVYCLICYTRFTSKPAELIPRSLNCTHTFCTGCLLKLQEYQGSVIECTRCKVRSFLPLNGVLGLKKNYDLLMASMDTNEGEQLLCSFCVRKLVYPPKTVTLNCSDCGVSFCGSCSDEVHAQPEFRMHDICLVDVNKNDNGNERVTRPTKKPLLRRSNSSLDSFPDCEEHGDKLKLFCTECKTVCCTYCQIALHKQHKTLHVHDVEDLDKRHLSRLQQRVDEYGETYIKCRGHVQKAIESTKNNDITTQDLIRRYFRELRTAIDEGERLIVDEISKRNKITLRSLNEQLSSMIEISSKANTTSRKCDEVLGLDYFHMNDVKEHLENDIKNVLQLECPREPCVSGQLFCQFPKHENLLNELRTCAKIVTAPDPPVQLKCKSLYPGNIHIEWSPPLPSPFIYPVLHYLVQAKPDDGDYCDIYKGSSTTISLATQDCKVINDIMAKSDDETYITNRMKNRVQFRVAAINIIGRSKWSSSFAIRLPL